ncbi:MAG: DUF2065 domain-containing protein [Steroidobacteraceae bacterium]
MLAWSDLLTAVALFLVIEGVAPFVNPGGLKRALAQLQLLGDSELRVAGLVSMLLGVALLIVVR